MSMTVQQFLANATEKSANDLLAAYNRLPEDKRNWAPAETSRSAANQIAECALLNLGLTNVLIAKTFAPDAMSKFGEGMAQLLSDLPTLDSALKANTAKVAEAIRNLSDEDLSIVVEMPWGARSLNEMIAVPLWNMTYHEGQVTQIALILGMQW